MTHSERVISFDGEHWLHCAPPQRASLWEEISIWLLTFLWIVFCSVLVLLLTSFDQKKWLFDVFFFSLALFLLPTLMSFGSKVIANKCPWECICILFVWFGKMAEVTFDSLLCQLNRFFFLLLLWMHDVYDVFFPSKFQRKMHYIWLLHYKYKWFSMFSVSPRHLQFCFCHNVQCLQLSICTPASVYVVHLWL